MLDKIAACVLVAVAGVIAFTLDRRFRRRSYDVLDRVSIVVACAACAYAAWRIW